VCVCVFIFCHGIRTDNTVEENSSIFYLI